MLRFHDRLCEMILAFGAAPGERLTERCLEFAFQGSQTPLRAAQLHLEAADLVCDDHRKRQVTPIDPSEPVALAELRGALETSALLPTCARPRLISLPLSPCPTRAPALGRASPVARPAWTCA
jgi:DNA-binding GntR family transcriptional regulator